MKYFPEVVQVIAGEQRKIVVYFSDGRITEFDVKPLIERGGIFKYLEDDKFFSQRLTVMNNTASWDLSGEHDPTNCIDIDPETLYDAKKIKDPLQVELVS